MFDHLISELRETILCLNAGKATLGYPFEPHSPETGFRGLPLVDVEKCMGCGACSNACTSRLITLRDSGDYRTVDFNLRRCTYCARCRDVCPQQALSMTERFETATPTPDDLRMTVNLRLVRCRECGAVVSTERYMNRVRDALVEQLKVPPEEITWLDLCLDCKRSRAMRNTALMVEVVS
jgi:hydrogenase-4 component H